ncbi:MAG: 16S rRNA (cytosine(1402)-N(4))-methyltransferase RsmH [Moraxellaceae bacterium]|nr:16S rRNA (cytosine(1402)-N(4))-methyltransferase RsmH [Moraxellaceae bacterium]MDZ4298757.1 16S rRNA (cytosine(1402)-N(4))-methyltransferase RsmH [Moraxellaceae bacterium]MDZ4386807.1 16S rRNA (cytosine(1402)-N(4))-methyltransferase RsmH [Moraxellaceae bacterium]
MTTPAHISVLLDETVSAVITDLQGVYVDATFGRGGHARALLAKLDSNARLIGFDKDPLAIAEAHALAQSDSRFSIVHDSFARLGQYCDANGLSGQVAGVMADLGVSSPQLDDAERGFSFMNDGPLDMRMDTTRGVTATQWLKDISESDLADVLHGYGEERYARRIAKAIVNARATRAIDTTKVLADIVAAAHPAWEKHKHPATRSFQAIRIALNRELDDLRDFLDQSLHVLAPTGRLAVISFHSLEDRMVKRFIEKHCKGDDFPAGLPVTQSQMRPLLKRVGKPVVPSENEVQNNVRARSSRLRVAERLAVTS